MPKTINVMIKKDKSIEIETEGFKGESCVTAIKNLFQEFVEVKDFSYKADFYEKEEIVNTEEVNI